MSFRSRSTFPAITALALCVAAAGRAQSPKDTSTIVPDSRVDIYAGYAYIHPVNSDIHYFEYQPVENMNVTASVSAYFNRYIGVQIEGAYFSGNAEHAGYDTANGVKCFDVSCDQLYYTAEAGPVFRLPLQRFVPFAHILGGGAKVNGPVNQPLKWGVGATAGAGVDYVLPYFNNLFALRLLQADFYFSRVNYGPLVLPKGLSGDIGDITAYKLSAGLVARFGEFSERPPVQLGCSVGPSMAFAGDPLTVTGSTIATNPKLKPTFTWTTDGGKVVGSGLYPKIDTKGMTPGEYTLKGHLSEGSKPRQNATCEAPFTIRAYDPPTITCAATPTVATVGTDISIRTSGGSPQNRPLTYSYAATEGVITSTGPTAMLSTAGLAAGSVTITCNVVDDLGKSATTTTQVTLNDLPKPIPVIPTQPLCSLSFTRDKRRPVRVDNEAKGCLDDIAIGLNQQTDAKLVIVGDFESPETNTAAAQRAVNARLYLTQEKGIDPSRIELRVGEGAGKTATDTLVPAGATFKEAGTHRFNESTVTPGGQPYGKAKKPAKGKAPVVKPGHAPSTTE
jgi:hypothetical protein